MRPPRLAIVAVLCLVGLASIAAVASAPPPTRLCGSCGTHVPGATSAGTLDIYVDGDGDSQWIERVPVNESAAERYRENITALEHAVDEAWDHWYVQGGNGDRTVALEDGTVVVNYTAADVARSGVGDAWLVDYFELDGNHRFGLAAERVTIHTPNETVITNGPQHADVSGNTATWTSDADFSDPTYITYGPSDGGIAGTASGYATLALEVGPGALGTAVLFGSVPGAVLGLVFLTIGRVDIGRDAVGPEFLERLLVVGGAIGSGGFLVVGASVATSMPDRAVAPGALALATLGIGYAFVGAAGRRWGHRVDTRGLIGIAAFATLVTGALMAVLAGPTPYIGAIPLGLATALFLPIGYAFERKTMLLGSICAAVLAPIVAVVVSSLTDTLFWIAVAATLAYPLAVLGTHRVRVDRTSTRRSTHGGASLAVGLVSLVVAAVWLLPSASWFVLIFVWTLLSLSVIAITVFGYPLALLGRHLASDGETR